MAKRIQKTSLPPIKGGCNYSLDLMNIDSDQAQFIKNCHIDTDGVVFTRKGERKLNSAAASDPITSIYDFRKADGTSTLSVIMVTAGFNLYKLVDGELIWLSHLQSDARPSWCTGLYNGASYAIMANGTDFRKYNGITEVTSVDPDKDYPWSTGAPRYLVEYDNRVLAAGCDSDPYVVWVSGLVDCTDWKPDESTAVYWQAKGISGDRVTGLSTEYNFGVIFKSNSVFIITEANANSTTAKQIKVCSEFGTTSHWSVQTVNNKIYFADESHIYKGVLREAIENGLEVSIIDKNVYRKYKNVANPTDIGSAYDVENKEIYWGIQAKGQTYVNTALIYNVGLSETDYNKRDIWSGWFENTSKAFNPYTLASVEISNTTKVFSGDEAGYVYVMGEDNKYKDNATDIATELRLPAVMPGGMTAVKRGRIFTPFMAQKYEGSTYVEWITNGSRKYPDSTRYLYLRNLVPYWDDGTLSRHTQVWGETVWNDRPIMPRQVTLDVPFNYIQFIIKNDGANDRDEIHYSGAEVHYQFDSIKRVV